MFSFHMDFKKLTLDGLIDTGALASAISEADLNKIKLLSNEAIRDISQNQIFKLWWQMVNSNAPLELSSLNLK